MAPILMRERGGGRSTGCLRVQPMAGCARSARELYGHSSSFIYLLRWGRCVASSRAHSLLAPLSCVPEFGCRSCVSESFLAVCVSLACALAYALFALLDLQFSRQAHPAREALVHVADTRVRPVVRPCCHRRLKVALPTTGTTGHVSGSDCGRRPGGGGVG